MTVKDQENTATKDVDVIEAFFEGKDEDTKYIMRELYMIVPEEDLFPIEDEFSGSAERTTEETVVTVEPTEGFNKVIAERFLEIYDDKEMFFDEITLARWDEQETIEAILEQCGAPVKRGPGAIFDSLKFRVVYRQATAEEIINIASQEDQVCYSQSFD